MGRNKKIPEEQKIRMSIYVPTEIIQRLDRIEIKNKSKLINWLLREYLGEGEVYGVKKEGCVL